MKRTTSSILKKLKEPTKLTFNYLIVSCYMAWSMQLFDNIRYVDMGISDIKLVHLLIMLTISLTYLGPLVFVSNLVLKYPGEADTGPGDVVCPGGVGH